jgi:hypothetical protein
MAYVIAISAKTINNSRAGWRFGVLSVARSKGTAVPWPPKWSAEFSFGEDSDPGAGGNVELIAGFPGPAVPLIR